MNQCYTNTTMLHWLTPTSTSASLFPSQKPLSHAAGLLPTYLVCVKLIFDFLHIIWHLLLHLEGILRWQQPGQYLLQCRLVTVQVHFQQGTLHLSFCLCQRAGRLRSGATGRSLRLKILKRNEDIIWPNPDKKVTVTNSKVLYSMY